MPELHDDRRQEPRFRAAGSATLKDGNAQHRALILDLSLNGLKITRPDAFVPNDRDLVQLTLSVGDSDPFKADVKIVHTERTELGLEFFDMPPRDFGVLAGIIEKYQRLRRSGTQ